jgi:hypothetical protein
MFNIFMDLVIKLILFHKNGSILIESCQFMDGGFYVIRIWKKGKYESNRSVVLKLNEIQTLEKLGASSDEIWRKFNTVMNILKRPKDNVVKKCLI